MAKNKGIAGIENGDNNSPKSALRSAIDSIKEQTRRRRSKKGEGTIKRLSVRVKRFPSRIHLPSMRNLQQTWPHFLEDYARCVSNLSEVERPACFHGYGFMAPPDAVNESRRAAATKAYINKRKWRDASFFQELLNPMLSEFSVEGYSLSLISRTSQVIKYEKGLDIEFISRNVSIDGHAVLSTGLFLLLDASTDWRLLYNPMVHGPPFIKFYAAVALRTKANVPIGVLAIFSPYPRNKVNPSLKHRLESICTRIIEFLDIPPSILSARIESPEETAPIDGCRDMLLTGTAMPADDNIKALLPHDYAIHYDMKTLRKLKNDHTVTQWYQISHELNGCISSRGAVEKASLILKDALGFSLVYAVEVRVSVSYLVPQVKFPYSSGTLCHEIVHLDELFKNETARDVRVRLLGGYGLTKEDSDESMDSEVHCYALESQYGVEYIAPDEKMSFRSGLLMPFKHSEAVAVYNDRFVDAPSEFDQDVRQNDSVGPFAPTAATINLQELIRNRCSKSRLDVIKDEDNEEKAPSNNSGMLTVRKRYGGYVMAGFSMQSQSYSPGDVEYMKLCVKALESIFQ